MPPLRRRRLPTTPRLQRATTTMPGRGQAPIAAAPIRPGPRARHPRKRQPKYPNADCPRRPHLNAQEPSLSGDRTAPAPAAPPPRPRASTSLVVLAPHAIGPPLWAAPAVLLPLALAMFFSLFGHPIPAAPIRPGPRARHPRKRQPKYPNADCPRRPHLNAQEPSLSGDSPAPAPAAPPPRPRASTSLVVLATLAIGYTLWAAQAVLLPIALAMFFALVGNPILRGLRKLWIPRFLGALLLLLVGLAATVLLGRQLVVPASEWVQQAPRELRLLTPKIKRMTEPVQQANEAAQTFAQATNSESKPAKVQVVTIQDSDPWKSLTATPKMIASILAVVLLTYFFMVFGENLQRNAIALLPTRQGKQITHDILQAFHPDISRNVLTSTPTNTPGVMILPGALYWLGVELPEALLWGTLAALLNFAPYVGPLVGVVLMLLMGFITYDEIGPSLLPAAIYLGLHTLEGQILTPVVLGRRMALSPLILILALMVFGWLWGIIGLLLAVPLLVCVKLVLAKIEGMEGWARLLE